MEIFYKGQCLMISTEKQKTLWQPVFVLLKVVKGAKQGAKGLRIPNIA